MTARPIFLSWLATRIAMRRSPQGLARRRERLWRELQPALSRTPALADHAGQPLAAFPISDPAAVRADYSRWNSLGCSHDQLHQAAAAAEAGGTGEVLPGIVAGYSTGTGGSRGLFVASATERADYIGQSLARLLPARALLRPIRLALMLRANSRLYSDLGKSRFAFAHFPLDRDSESTAQALAEFAPNILIAPSHRLVELAAAIRARRLALPHLDHLFFGAEPMSASERAWVEDAFGVRPDPIYQATEGFLAAACAHGRLHLNEHSLAIELEPIAGTPGHRAVVTDLRRRSQPIVRLRMDDYLECGPQACGCGYAGRVIKPVMGRVADIWRWGDRSITPAQATETLDALLGVAARWQAIASIGRVELRIDPPIDAERARRAAVQFAADLEIPVPVLLGEEPPEPPSPKRKRLSWTGPDA
jgi:putative adenylate-forming enzyme